MRFHFEASAEIEAADEAGAWTKLRLFCADRARSLADPDYPVGIGLPGTLRMTAWHDDAPKAEAKKK